MTTLARPSDAEVMKYVHGSGRLFERIARERQARAYEPQLAAYRAKYPQDTIRVLTPDLLRRRLEYSFREPEAFTWIDGVPVPLLHGGAANTSPIFPLTPNLAFATITAANTATDGTGTVNALVTGGTNGSRLDRILLLPLGTCVASKAYIFLNNSGTNATATNNALIRDIPLAAATASNTALIGSPVEITLAFPLKATWIINATLGTAVVGGWKVIAIAGDF